MMISTRGRYALRVMIDLAENQNGGYIPLKEIAGRQQISLKYMQSIMPVLAQNGFVAGIHGKGGAYRLNCRPEQCRVGDILRLTEGSLAPVSCLERGAKPCGRAADCRTLPMWNRLHTLVADYLHSVTLADLMRETVE